MTEPYELKRRVSTLPPVDPYLEKYGSREPQWRRKGLHFCKKCRLAYKIEHTHRHNSGRLFCGVCHTCLRTGVRTVRSRNVKENISMAENPDKPYKKICKTCKKDFNAEYHTIGYCSEKCRIEGRRKIDREKRHKKPLILVFNCKNCNAYFQTQLKNKLFCTTNCRTKYKAMQRRTKLAKEKSTIETKEKMCYKPICASCRKEFVTDRKTKVYCSKRCKWRDNYYARREKLNRDRKPLQTLKVDIQDLLIDGKVFLDQAIVGMIEMDYNNNTKTSEILVKLSKTKMIMQKIGELAK